MFVCCVGRYVGTDGIGLIGVNNTGDCAGGANRARFRKVVAHVPPTVRSPSKHTHTHSLSPSLMSLSLSLSLARVLTSPLTHSRVGDRLPNLQVSHAVQQSGLDRLHRRTACDPRRNCSLPADCRGDSAHTAKRRRSECGAEGSDAAVAAVAQSPHTGAACIINELLGGVSNCVGRRGVMKWVSSVCGCVGGDGWE